MAATATATVSTPTTNQSQHQTKTNCATGTRAMDWLRIVHIPSKWAYTHAWVSVYEQAHRHITFEYMPFFLSNMYAHVNAWHLYHRAFSTAVLCRSTFFHFFIFCFVLSSCSLSLSLSLWHVVESVASTALAKINQAREKNKATVVFVVAFVCIHFVYTL